MHWFLKFIFGIKLYMLRTVPLSIIWSFSLYTQQHLYVLLCVQWKTPDDGQRNCPKHVELYSKNKFEKLVHLVGFVIRMYHDARSAERETHHLYSGLELAMYLLQSSLRQHWTISTPTILIIVHS